MAQIEEAKEYRAVVCTQYGPAPGNLQIQSRSMPSVGPNQILVQVHRASINPVDYKIARGYLKILRFKFPFAVGCDFAGVVDKVGEKVSATRPELKQGVRVAGISSVFDGMGSFAEYALVDVGKSCVAALPDSVSFDVGAGLGIAGLTSFQVMYEKSGLKEGDKVLILGGSSATGLMAIQMARLIGCAEIVCTSSRAQLCSSLGATRVINYRTDKWHEQKEMGAHDFQCVYDCVGEQDGFANAQKTCLKSKGTYVDIVGKSSGELNITSLASSGATIAYRKMWSLFGSCDYVMYTMQHRRFDELMQLVKDSKLRVLIDEESPFEFDDFASLYAKSASSKAHGKLLLKIR